MRNLILIFLTFIIYSLVGSQEGNLRYLMELKCIIKFPCSKNQIGQRCGGPKCLLVCRCAIPGMTLPQCLN